nr:MAG: hypothetical protein E4H34_01255 [Hyphomicrobiales bacterium]
MKYRIEGFAKEFPDGYALESDTAAGAMAAFHKVADLCGGAQIFRGEHPVMLSKLHELAEQEKQAAKGDDT